MNAISSMYGSPKSSSMTSRDPTGLDPSGVDDSGPRLEPTGSRADDSLDPLLNFSSDDDGDPVEEALKEEEDAASTERPLIDVVRLVGAPPPPPKTPPPRKAKRRTPKNKAGVTPKIANGSSSASFDDDSLLYSVTGPSQRGTEITSPTEKGGTTMHVRNTEDPPDSPQSDKVDSPPREQPVREGPGKPSTPKDIVEERVRAALALYESEDLVLDDHHKQNNEVPLEVLRPSKVPVENKSEAVPELSETLVKTEKKVNEDPPSKIPSPNNHVPPSPSSEATRQHSNQTLENKTFANAMDILSHINESPQEAASPPGRREAPQPSPQNRRTSSVERHKTKAKEEKQKRDQKRGFFKKLFRGRTKTRDSLKKNTRSSSISKRSSSKQSPSPRSRSASATKISPRSRSSPNSHSKLSPSPISRSSPRSTREPKRDYLAEGGWRPVKHSPRSSSQSHPLKPTLKSEQQRHYQGPPVDAQPAAENELESAFDEAAEQIPPPSLNIEEKSPEHDLPGFTSQMEEDETDAPYESPPRNSYSQDPPDDEHGDPPVFSGRPLVSPTSYNTTLRVNTSNDHDEKSRAESVKSRIAEMYEGRSTEEPEDAPPYDKDPVAEVPTSLSQNQNDYFFGQDIQDEVSALTGTFGSKSFEPAPSHDSHDDEGDGVEVVDPYTTTVYDKETVETALPTPANATSLRVNVQGPSQDPAGASPMKWDYRAANGGFRDPVGESPMHAWNKKTGTDDHGEEVDDPALTAGFHDEDDDSAIEEEKKEEEPANVAGSASSSNSGTAFEKDFFEGTDSKSGNNPSQATRDALKLDQVAATDSMKETTDSVATPKISGNATRKVLKDEIASEKGLTVNSAAWTNANSVAYLHRLHGQPSPRHTWHDNKDANNTSPKAGLRKENRKQSKKRGKSIDVNLKTYVEKDGFKSASSTPVNGKTALTVTTAAFTNAKAVAYLHRLHGEASPRHTWHASRRKKADLSPLALKVKTQKSAKKNSTQAPGSSKKPSPDEYGAHNFDESLVNNDETAPRVMVHLEELHPIKTKEGALFSAYNSKFQGRKPTKKSTPKVETPKGSRLSLGSRGRPDEAEAEAQDKNKKTAASRVYDGVIPGKITGWAVSMGMKLRRSKRDDNVANGSSARVVLTPREKIEGRNRFKFVPHNESEIKDPIQRAGRRLLSKSAIPIQCAMRRFLARRQAIDRMWALIEIQSYYRRWRAETNLQASIYAATRIQCAVRGWLARDKLKDMHSSAVQIQKIVRSYLCQAKVYDTMYYIVRIQALLRGCYERKAQKQKKQAAKEIQRYLRGFAARLDDYKNSQAVPIQAIYRGHKARQEYNIALASVTLLQTVWRAYAARIAYQIEIVDIIIVQSVVRRWFACRYAQTLKDDELSTPASIIQGGWRGHMTRKEFRKVLAARKIQAIWRGFDRSNDYKKHSAARTIQCVWRGFQCYTNYIFSLVDILVVQRTARQWLARRKANNIRKKKAAIKVQAFWRRHKAQSALLFSLVHIIITQSVARRWLSRSAVATRRSEVEALREAVKRKHDAATAIQKMWRGFWGFSHYIIMQYEITRLQAALRGNIARQSYSLKLGCAIIIQANIRRHLAKHIIENRILAETMTESAALALRERNAAKKIQFWWRIVLDWTKEKKAALTIERFFINVRQEVDREILRRERRKVMKKEKRRQKRRESDEKMLERAWLNTVDENTAVGGYSLDTRSETSTRSRSAPRARESSDKGRDPPIRASPSPKSKKLQSPRGGSVGQEVDINGWPIHRIDSSASGRSKPPTEAVRMATSEDNSEVSNITNPTVFNRMGQPPGAYDGQCRSSREKRLSTEDYIKKYGGSGGLQTAPNRMSSSGSGGPHHFFSEAGSGESTKKQERSVPTGMPMGINIPPHIQTQNSTPRNIPSTPSSRRRSSSTPRSHSGNGFSPSVNARGFPTPSGGSKSKSSSTTPRNNLSAPDAVPSTPRCSAPNPVPSPRIPIGIPPATPRSHKGSKLNFARTAETESQTTYSQNSFSKSSPRSRSDGRVVKHGNPVVVMKSYPNFTQSRSIEESQEVMYLGSEELGDEYGEV